MAFKILCSVSGGVTGSRSAFLKCVAMNLTDRVEMEFASLEEAQKHAATLQANVSPYSTATFSYRAVEV